MPSNYDHTKFAVLPADDDSGYELVRKNYKRFIWNFDDYKNNEPLPKGPTSKKKLNTFEEYKNKK